jgi:hypothetical protein
MKKIITLSILFLVLGFSQAVYKGGDVRLSPRLLNYQGYLTDTLGNPITNPAVSVTFGIWSASSGGTQLWFEDQTVSVAKGIFSVLLGNLTTLPDSVFSKGTNRWLELTYSGATLSPRTRIVSAAYAISATYSDTAAYARLLQGKDTVALDARYVNEGQVNSIFTPMVIDTAVTMAKIARAGASANQVIKWTGSAWQPANDMSSLDNHWAYLVSDVADTTLQMGGRWGLARLGNTLYGNADSTHVNFGVACTTGTSGMNYKYCTVAGGNYNIAGVSYSTIGGGLQNTARGNYAFVGGGYINEAINGFAAVVGGYRNTASGAYALVGGGYTDTASGYAATIGGGYDNLASGDYTTLGGGRLNSASGIYATVAGGWTNSAVGSYAAVVGGYRNVASGNLSVAAGGNADTVNAVYGFIGSGYGNLAGDSLIDTAAVVAGGYNNSATSKYSFVGGGWGNTTSGSWTTVAGGNGNNADTSYAAVGGGVGNTASGYISFIGGGQANTASGNWATVAGGRGNFATNYYATVGGGRSNSADSLYATVGGGYYNRANGNYAFVGGGIYDTVLAFYGSVVSGYNNKAGDALADTAATVCGGYDNAATSKYSFVGGGYADTAGGWGATVGGGITNSAPSNYSTVGGGIDNRASGLYSTVGGGRGNRASVYGTVPGGCMDTIDGTNYSFAANYHSKVEINDNNSAAFTGSHTTAVNQVRAQAFSTGALVFTMDHPSNPNKEILNQYAMGSNEAILFYRGTVILGADGRASVDLPDYFDRINRNPMIQLTGVGSSEVVYVAEDVKGNSFVVGGKPGIKVYWTVTAERKDIHAEIARTLTPVKQPKTGDLINHSLDDDALIGVYEKLQEKDPGYGFTFRTEEGRGVHEQSKRLIEEGENK